MLNKILIMAVIALGVYNLNAYEVPKIDVDKKQKPEIVLFVSESILVKEKLSYKITWKTINATNVQITFIGKVDLSGDITVTEDEYNRGAITLTASSKNSTFSDSKTINKHKNSDAPQTIFVEPEKDNRAIYSTPMLYPVGARRPLRRRRNYR
ncbi:MAG: hypothetical protein J7J96_06220 [Sulfurimonas sp.]|nr:hypothetical protein [Sulfurimonas sp.]